MIPSILIVEDDLTFSTMLKTWLGKKGFDVETAGTCAKARKQITSKEFSLILSDLRLPDQDGMQLLTWMRELDINTPFIMMTSYGEIQNAVTAMKLGATDYIKKPVQPDELLKKINEAKYKKVYFLYIINIILKIEGTLFRIPSIIIDLEQIIHQLEYQHSS